MVSTNLHWQPYSSIEDYGLKVPQKRWSHFCLLTGDPAYDTLTSFTS